MLIAFGETGYVFVVDLPQVPKKGDQLTIPFGSVKSGSTELQGRIIVVGHRAKDTNFEGALIPHFGYRVPRLLTN